MQSIENKVIARIYGYGKGWVFSQIDFADLGSRQSIDVSLHRLSKAERIRRVVRGIYDYPKFSKYLNQMMSPDFDQVARALARKYGWRIQISGPAALNLLGLSTQVPGRLLYLSDGPSKVFKVMDYTIEFKKTALKESGFNHIESGIIVQALKSLGPDRITDSIKMSIRNWLDSSLYSVILKDTKVVTSWINQAIHDICREKK
ncbi:MAG: hypothetical protein KAW14_09550 [Candidatus Aegiribacteria sp.]|nr:hypothetical protein [Candidatus Aegiribacteria sp.]